MAEKGRTMNCESRGRAWRPGICLAAALAVLGVAACRSAAPADGGGQPGITGNAEISAMLAKFAADAPGEARVECLGTSAGGLPLEALCVGDFTTGPDDPARPLTFLLVGTQHGMEPSGGEAILRLAGELLSGAEPWRHLRAPRDAVSGPASVRYVLVPNLNPDGRDRNRRVNAAKVNLSTDFTLLTQPETRALARLLATVRPDAVLDLHESAVWKKKTLGAQGYLLDFDAQFETANHPAVAPPIRDLCFASLLPETIAATAASGVPAQRYIGEITRLDQTLVHGGLSLRNLRNYAGLRGCVSFLVENRLDPSSGTYPTPRNIAERTRKQHASLLAFLRTCIAHRGAIRAAVEAARQAELTPDTDAWPLPASAEYVPIPGRETIVVNLRRLADGELEPRSFAYHGGIRGGPSLPSASAYRINARVPEVAAWLTLHGLGFESRASNIPADKGEFLLVPLNQPGGRLAALLLDPDSAAALWRTPAFADTPPAPASVRCRFP